MTGSGILDDSVFKGAEKVEKKARHSLKKSGEALESIFRAAKSNKNYLQKGKQTGQGDI